ncbi:MAG TPA: hypothetical protein PKK06_11130 [Phycisphaerae bacterium]|nr:hypothetical protein [Phycisphaerae bacterium]HNU44368.1 hypothetical protein [Phycisphaerae bacterium]
MYQPTAATGNSRCLVTLGASGEVMGFFYPRLDFAQNVREGMFGVYVRSGSGGRFEWCFGEAWDRRQHFQPGTNIIVTELRHRSLGIRVRVSDLVPPGEQALVRNFEVQREGGAGEVVLYQYFNLAPADVDRRNAVQWLPDRRIVVQQFRDVVLAVGASQPFEIACGTVERGGHSHVKRGMQAGVVRGSDQCMGNVEFATAFEVGGASSWEGTLVLAGGRSRPAACNSVARLRDSSVADLKEAAAQRSTGILQRVPRCGVDELRGAYERAVLSLMDLFDTTEGTFLAAPECDPFYAYSGGYGYCWPRDAAVSALTVARLGFRGMAERFFDWCAHAQLDDGHWYQRYWTDGLEAPAWCVRHNEIQLDQTCAVLHAAALFGQSPGPAQRQWIERFAPVARRAAAAIVAHIDESGLHKQAADLWECSYGSFAYTNAGVIAALREGARTFGLEVPDLERLRGVLIERLYLPDKQRWARRIAPEGYRDETMDSSALGLIEPWDVLNPADPELREMAVQTVESIDRILGVDMPQGRLILRFEHETYMGGAPGCVNTLWLAQCRLRLAQVATGAERTLQVELARRLIGAALACANPTGQLPELVPRNIGQSYWAAPHGWASSLFIQCVLMLSELPEFHREPQRQSARTEVPATPTV